MKSQFLTLSFIPITFLILVIKDGQIVECGTRSELLGRVGRYRSLYKRQARV